MRIRDLICGNLACGTRPTVGHYATTVVSQVTCTGSARTDRWAYLDFGQTLVGPGMANDPAPSQNTWQVYRLRIFSDANHALRLLDALRPRINTPLSPMLLRDDPLGPQVHAGETRISGLRGWDRC